MREKKRLEFLKEKDLIEYNKMISDIEQNMYQRDHWRRQQIYWVVIGTVAITMMIVSALFDFK